MKSTTAGQREPFLRHKKGAVRRTRFFLVDGICDLLVMSLMPRPRDDAHGLTMKTGSDMRLSRQGGLQLQSRWRIPTAAVS